LKDKKKRMTECKNNWTRLYELLYGGKECENIKQDVDDFIKE